MIRILDIILSSLGILVLLSVGLIILVIGFFDTGSPIFIQKRIGKHKKVFNLIKFRTMKLDTASLPTHLVLCESVTRFGKFLRKSKLDELPQLINVLMGDMSLVGPRPNLIEQKELIELRDKFNVYDYRPGITGLSQINQIDMSDPEKLAQSDSEMLQNFNIKKYIQYLFLTLSGKGFGDKIRI